jgi:hypothetical protein
MLVMAVIKFLVVNLRIYTNIFVGLIGENGQGSKPTSHCQGQVPRGSLRLAFIGYMGVVWDQGDPTKLHIWRYYIIISLYKAISLKISIKFG